MMDDFGAIGLSAMAELNYLRLEAMDLFERCLTEGRATFLEDFIEEQISQEPPRLDVLRDVAEDLHQRLLSLREYHFDVMERTARTLSDDFGLNMGPAAKASADASSALLDPAQVLRLVRDLNPNLSSGDEALVRRMLEMSAETAGQLREDIRMTEALFGCINDWVDGLSATIARRFWNDGRSDAYSGAVQ
jgi:hypothetical protein